MHCCKIVINKSFHLFSLSHMTLEKGFKNFSCLCFFNLYVKCVNQSWPRIINCLILKMAPAKLAAITIIMIYRWFYTYLLKIWQQDIGDFLRFTQEVLIYTLGPKVKHHTKHKLGLIFLNLRAIIESESSPGLQRDLWQRVHTRPDFLPWEKPARYLTRPL